MKIFIFGATGFLGGALARHFKAAGHDVHALARTDASAVALQQAGIAPFIGDLEMQLDDAVARTDDMDAVIFAPQLMKDVENSVVSAMLQRMEGRDKSFLFTSGTGVLGQRTGGDWSEDSFAEDDPFVPLKALSPRVETERLVREAPARGIRGIVLRPPSIWGTGYNAHVSQIYRSVALTGAACYIGAGLNLYSNVHIDDLVKLYDLALRKGAAGALYHSVGGETPNRWIAEAVARDMQCETQSLSMDEAIEVWGEFVTLIMLGVSSRARSPRSRRELGWRPEQLDMLSIIGHPHFRKLATAAAGQ